MSMSGFTYGRSIQRRFIWYCQTPGIRWATDPQIGWELYKTAEGHGPATWYLMGHGVEEDLCTSRLKEAMTLALAEIDKREAGE